MCVKETTFVIHKKKFQSSHVGIAFQSTAKCLLPSLPGHCQNILRFDMRDK